jgi:hypothetical protein
MSAIRRLALRMAALLAAFLCVCPNVARVDRTGRRHGAGDWTKAQIGRQGSGVHSRLTSGPASTMLILAMPMAAL